jgi:CBS domain-containing protein
MHNGGGSGGAWRSLLVGLGAGSLLSYLLDPVLGRRRRATARDRARRAAHLTTREASKIEHELLNRAHGFAARWRALSHPDPATDQVIGERVRAALGRVCSRASAIEVSVTNGRAALSGPILEREHAPVMRTVARVRGVRAVEDRLHRHIAPDGVQALRTEGMQKPGHGQSCAELMKGDVQTLVPDDTVRWAAEKMTWADVGFLPICDLDRHVLGAITDRDIIVRAVAKGRSPEETRVDEVMSNEVVFCRMSDDIAEAERLMSQHQVSRIVVTDGNGVLQGVISLSDLAERASARRAARTLRAVAAREAPRP